MKYNTAREYFKKALLNWRALGKQNTVEDCRKKLTNYTASNGVQLKEHEKKALLEDCASIIDMMQTLSEEEKSILQKIYMASPKKPKRNEITNRIQAVSLEKFISTAKIYKILANITEDFARRRKLSTAIL